MSDLANILTEWRRHLHQHPETAFEEVQTAAFVADRLREMGIEVVEHIGKTGVVGTLKAGKGQGALGLRAPMDAINLTERGDLPYRSVNDGKMHACGHDGHTVTLLGAAMLLSHNRDFNGTVHFVFQPAEEPGKGARAMLEDGLLYRFPMDEIYGLRNFPALPAGCFHTRPGPFCSSEDNFSIKIRGWGGHASSPHFTVDPLVIGAEVVLALQTIVSRNANPMEAAVVSCTEFITDGAHNAIPSNVTILGDTRSYTPSMRKLIESRMRDICEGICKMHGAGCEFTYTHEFAPTVNWPESTAAAVKAAEAVAGKGKVDDNAVPFTGSEDFGVFLENIPGCYLFLGSGAGVSQAGIPTYNSRFDYNDDVLETGAAFFAELARQRLPQ